MRWRTDTCTDHNHHMTRQSIYIPSYTRETERIACGVSEAYERSQGRDPVDVSGGYRPSCDYVSFSVDGSTRYIEVKGRRGRQTSVSLVDRQLQAATTYPSDWWLYAVFDCATKPVLYVLNHVAELRWELQSPAKAIPSGKQAPAVGQTAVWQVMPEIVVSAGTRVQ